jgi:hypothetical protein
MSVAATAKSSGVDGKYYKGGARPSKKTLTRDAEIKSG